MAVQKVRNPVQRVHEPSHDALTASALTVEEKYR